MSGLEELSQIPMKSLRGKLREIAGIGGGGCSINTPVSRHLFFNHLAYLHGDTSINDGVVYDNSLIWPLLQSVLVRTMNHQYKLCLHMTSDCTKKYFAGDICLYIL